MKKNILLFLMSFLFFISTDAQARNCSVQDPCCCYVGGTNFYGKVFFGANFLQDNAFNENKFKYDAGYIVAGSLGYNGCYGLRLEGEYSYRRNSIKKADFSGQDSSHHGHFQSSSYMANLLWDLPLSPWPCLICDVRSFVGAGIGYDCQQIHSSNSNIIFNQKWHHFSWQLMAGLALPIFCNTEVTLEYKFHQGGCHFYNHSLGVGLVYKLTF